MSDPYLMLGVGPDADDAAIHAAWLAAVKACPPERDAHRFEQVRTAYATIRTRKQRIAYELFDTRPPCGEDILDRAAPEQGLQRPDPALIEALLRGVD